jgi:energy-coupling factor transporter ATP-binding protein EcfA2
MHAVEFRDVCLTVGGRVILDAVSLDIAPREFVGVLGPNGSGKTTLMRAVLGLISPSRGTIWVLGRPATRGIPAASPGLSRRHATERLGFRGRCRERPPPRPANPRQGSPGGSRTRAGLGRREGISWRRRSGCNHGKANGQSSAPSFSATLRRGSSGRWNLPAVGAAIFLPVTTTT